MPATGHNNRGLTESERRRAAKYIWSEMEPSPHLSHEDLSHYAELSVNQPERLASEQMQELSRHLMQCDECLGDYLLLVEALKQPGDEQSQVFGLDLSFLGQLHPPATEAQKDLGKSTEMSAPEVESAQLPSVSLAGSLTAWLRKPWEKVWLSTSQETRSKPFLRMDWVRVGGVLLLAGFLLVGGVTIWLNRRVPSSSPPPPLIAAAVTETPTATPTSAPTVALHAAGEVLITASHTPVEAMATPILALTSIPTSTSMPTPTFTSTPIPTSTSMPIPTPTPEPTPTLTPEPIPYTRPVLSSASLIEFGAGGDGDGNNRGSDDGSPGGEPPEPFPTLPPPGRDPAPTPPFPPEPGPHPTGGQSRRESPPDQVFVSLHWSWDAELEENEFFEVQVWHEGHPYHTGVAWVKTTSFDFNLTWSPRGQYFWSVIVIEGTNLRTKPWSNEVWEGDIVRESSPESEIGSFVY